MTVVAFLQNMWFKDPEGAKRVFTDHPDRREYLISAFLFMGCLTGRRLRAAFGEDTCERIVWEECSREIGGRSSSAFPADMNHIRAVIRKHSPDIVLAFGRIAVDAVNQLRPLPKCILTGPHPAARSPKTTEQLEWMAEQLRGLLAEQE